MEHCPRDCDVGQRICKDNTTSKPPRWRLHTLNSRPLPFEPLSLVVYICLKNFLFLLYDGLYLGFAMGSPMSDFLLQTVLFHVAFLMSGRFCCCGGYCCYSLTASQKRSLMMMRWTEWIQLRFRKIPLSTQSTGQRMLRNVLVSILAHPPMRLHGNYCCDYTQAWHIWDIDISCSLYSCNKPTKALLNIRKQHRPTSCNIVRRLHDDHVDFWPCQTYQPEWLFA